MTLHRVLLFSATLLCLPSQGLGQDHCGLFDALDKADVLAEIRVSGTVPYPGQALIAHTIVFEDDSSLTFENDIWPEVQIVADEIVLGNGITISSKWGSLRGADADHHVDPGYNGTYGTRNGGNGPPGIDGDDGRTLDRLDLILAAKSIRFERPDSTADIDLRGIPGGDGGNGGDGGAGGRGAPGISRQVSTNPSTHEEYCSVPPMAGGDGGNGGAGGHGGDAGAGGTGGDLIIAVPSLGNDTRDRMLLRATGAAAGTGGLGGLEAWGGDPGDPPAKVAPCDPVQDGQAGIPHSGQARVRQSDGRRPEGNGADGRLIVEICSPG